MIRINMRSSIIISLLLLSSQIFSQEKYHSYKPIFYEDESLKIVRISNFEFVQNIDSNFIQSFLKYRLVGEKSEKFYSFDTLDYSSYKTDIRPFYSQDYSDYLILWIIYKEFDSEIKVYYLTGKNIYKVGELPISSACKHCDEISYPPDKIRVKGTRELIQISFLDPVMIKQNGDVTNTYLPGKMEFLFDKTTKILEMHLP